MPLSWGRRIVAAVGRTFIAAGVLILLFVAYQLWGTGLAEARSQSALKDDFAAQLAGPRVTEPEPLQPDEPAPDPTIPPPAPTGAAVAIIKIPDIGVEKAVVEGVTVGALKKGPGHYPTTPMPGQPGNAAIAGHRTTYGAPFFRLDELETGDPILVTTLQGSFRYEVRERKVVRPSQNEVLDPSDENLLTLTTCEPRFSAAKRLIVVAQLVDRPAPAAPPPVVPVEPDPEPDPDEEEQIEGEFGPEDMEPGDDPGGDGQGSPGPGAGDPSSPTALDDRESVSGDPAARGPAVGWGAVAALVWLLTWLVGKWWRRWPAYLLGTPAFLVVLYLFFENFARLLPANY